jgi:hypothetical protein
LNQECGLLLTTQNTASGNHFSSTNKYTIHLLKSKEVFLPEEETEPGNYFSSAFYYILSERKSQEVFLIYFKKFVNSGRVTKKLILIN